MNIDSFLLASHPSLISGIISVHNSRWYAIIIDRIVLFIKNNNNQRNNNNQLHNK